MKNVGLNLKEFKWTHHVKDKMRFYALSENRVKRVFRHPDRIEEGVADETIAAMQRAGSKNHPYEIWIMYQVRDDCIRMISAWRYPGISPTDKSVPIPTEIREELGI